MNPYFNRGCIEDANCFFGRERELQEIFNLLCKPISQSASIVGQRKIGKSSLLKHIMRPETMIRYGADPQSLVMVYVNFEGLAYFSEMECLQKLLWDACLALAPIMPPDELKIDGSAAAPFLMIESLNRVFRWLKRQNKRLVFLFDEFELSCGNPHLTSRFFNTLRSFSTNYGVAYVVATMKELWHLPHSKGARSSPFFNYFTTLYLGLFTAPEADALLSLGALQDQAPTLLRQAGLFPFFLQLLCWYVWDHRARGDSQDPLQEFTRQAVPHFAFFWEHLSGEEQEALARLAQPGTSVNTPVLERLQHQALVRVGESGARLFSETFTDFVRGVSVSRSR